MNKVYLIGNLTRDPELSQSASGVSYCKFGIAVNRRFSQNNEVDFFNIVVWRQQADNCAKFLKKGNKVAVVGSIQTRTYEKDGEKRSAVDISAEEVEFLTPKGGDGGGDYGGGGGNYGKQKEVSELTPIEADEDLPF